MRSGNVACPNHSALAIPSLYGGCTANLGKGGTLSTGKRRLFPSRGKFLIKKVSRAAALTLNENCYVYDNRTRATPSGQTGLPARWELRSSIARQCTNRSRT